MKRFPTPSTHSHCFTRRELLAASAAGVLATLACPSLFAAAPASPPPLTFGFSTYGMKSLATEAAIKTIAEIGFDSVELAVLAGWDADAMTLTPARRTAIRNQLRDSGVKLTSLMENVPPTADDAKHQANLERLKAAAQVAHDLSPDHPPLIETVTGGREWEKTRPLLLARLPDWVKLADAHDVIVAIKPHRGSAMSRPEQAIEIFEALGSPRRLRMVYDYSHFALRDMPMEQTIRTSVPWTAFISVKDVAVENGREVFKLPGETGTIDYPAMFRQFAAAGYAGDVNCEISSMISSKPGYDSVAAAKQCYANLAPAFGVARVGRG